METNIVSNATEGPPVASLSKRGFVRLQAILNDAQQTAFQPVVSLSKRDFARHQSVSQRTLDNWRTQGLPCLLISSRCVRFPVADCDQWIRDKFLIVRGGKAVAK